MPMCLHRRRIATLAALTIAVAAASAPRARAQVAYDGPHGRVEVLGLHHWTLAALEDSIRHRVPGQSLADAACMVTLRDSLHFADALVENLNYQSTEDGPFQKYLIIKLVEPQDSSRVRWTKTWRDSFRVLRPEYAKLVLPVTDSLGGLELERIHGPLQYYGREFADRAEAMREWPPYVRADAERLWAFIDAHESDADRRTAIATLNRDGEYANRVAAAAVLAGHALRDSTWWALAEALRDGNQAVRTTALLVLQNLPARKVDWRPATSGLRALLGGTNMNATQAVMTVLATAEYPGARYAAHALLVQLNGGRDLGTDAAVWQRWIAAL
jgi:hypothetical protein